MSFESKRSSKSFVTAKSYGITPILFLLVSSLLYISSSWACQCASPQEDKSSPSKQQKSLLTTAKMKGGVISVLVVLAMVQIMVKPGVQATVTCQQVDDALEPCVPFLTSRAGHPTAACCDGVGRLQKIAQTPTDKQEACTCAKDAAARLPAVKEDAAASLPAEGQHISLKK
ncbi:Bifunctional inhibitor/lipid-transfer protein/seed storage 2S albumin superfamily protein, putative [Theobroma cacao]|uniref:Bifunctional inhibitor/lipid-transfer protein/seed storage 2S albumin superfamily protein, putative n=2 Tax=Theobroma cacao TaxID=3641 RepID=A0A061DVL8_THECC|nr:Bifunctional inhibitor/lipid-transfer protein/seed storage 2S albumin superfamily protein, putative [Theobroma cacao]